MNEFLCQSTAAARLEALLSISHGRGFVFPPDMLRFHFPGCPEHLYFNELADNVFPQEAIFAIDNQVTTEPRIPFEQSPPKTSHLAQKSSLSRGRPNKEPQGWETKVTSLHGQSLSVHVDDKGSATIDHQHKSANIGSIMESSKGDKQIRPAKGVTKQQTSTRSRFSNAIKGGESHFVSKTKDDDKRNPLRFQFINKKQSMVTQGRQLETQT